jgi:hypothetical protein
MIRRTLGCVRRFLLGLAPAALLLAASGSMAQVELGAAVDTFIAIAEQGEYGAKAPGITRWSRPIRVATAGRPTPDQSDALIRHVEGLAKRTGLAMEIVPPLAASASVPSEGVPIDLADPMTMFQVMYHLPAQGWTTFLAYGHGERVAIVRGDLLVVYADHRSVTRIASILRVENPIVRRIASGDMPCFAFFYTEPAVHEIRYAIVVLRTDVPDWMRRRCLHEEVTQALGLRNDVKGSEITLFDDLPLKRRTELTPHDWMFLEVLYDPRLKPGMQGAELRRVARQLIAERWPPR